MRTVVQRVLSAKVRIEHSSHAEISQGLLLFVGVEEADKPEDVAWLAHKIAALRIFADQAGSMNLSVNDVNGQVLVISQFTLHAKTKKGNRPSFLKAAQPDVAIPLYESFVNALDTNVQGDVRSGIFGANMQIASVNDGPVTLLIDTKNKE